MDELNMAAVARFVPDAWLAQVLERPVFRLAAAATVQDELLADEMKALSGGADAFFYARLPTSDVAGSIALAAAGFAVIDTAITLAWAGPARDIPDGAVQVGPATRAHDEAIPAIAESCFRWSRFHLDPQLPQRLANLIKRRWLESYVRGTRGSALYAAEKDGAVAGFLAVIESAVNGRPVAVIDLLGVASRYQGHGVGAALVGAFVKDWRGRAAELRVGTQAANIRSLRLYESCGFRIADSSYVLHAHYRSGRIQRCS